LASMSTSVWFRSGKALQPNKNLWRICSTLTGASGTGTPESSTTRTVKSGLRGCSMRASASLRGAALRDWAPEYLIEWLGCPDDGVTGIANAATRNATVVSEVKSIRMSLIYPERLLGAGTRVSGDGRAGRR